MKIAMLQFDERVDDENIKAGTALNKAYCEMHGYDYIFKALTEEDMHHDLDDYLMDDKNAFKMNVYDYRIKMIEQYMNDYDYLIYLDTDAIIYNTTIKVEDLIDGEHGMYLFPDSTKIGLVFDLYNCTNILVNKSKDSSYILKDPLKDLCETKINDASIYEYLFCRFASNPEGLASGIIIIDCHYDKLKDFINDFNRFYPLFENCVMDQGCIATLIRRKKYKDMCKILPAYLQGNPFLNNLNVNGLDDYKLTDKSFICHFYSFSSKKEECKKYIEEIKQNKYNE